MITIHHILNDGSEAEDVAGKVIKASEHPTLYEVINRIQKEGEKKKDEVISTSGRRTE